MSDDPLIVEMRDILARHPEICEESKLLLEYAIKSQKQGPPLEIYWVRRSVLNENQFSAALLESAFNEHDLLDELKIMAMNGPIERILANRVMIGEGCKP